MIEAILFDFNGIIVDDESVQLEAYREALKPEAIELTDEQYYDALGMDDRSFVRAQFARAGKLMSEEAMLGVLERKAQTHRQRLDAELPLFPGVITFVKACARHYTTGLVSMARREDVEYVLERAGLKDAFDAVVCAEDVEAHKPDPECYNLAFRLVDRARHKKNLNLLVPENCLVVEDSPPGIEAARLAGMRTLGVTNTVTKDELRRAGAEVITHSLADWTTDSVRYVYERPQPVVKSTNA